MRRSSLLYGVVAAALILPLPAHSARVAAPRAGLPGHGLTIYTDYADRGVTEIFDAAGRLVSRVVSGGSRSHASPGLAAQDAPEAPSQSQRCSNSGTYEWNEPGVPRPWRMTEQFHINGAGAPSNRVSDWRNQLIEGKRAWEITRNLCGIGDTIIWDMPARSFDTSTPANPDCGEPDSENVVAWADLGGWSDQGLVLARTCTWWDSEFIYESDLIFNYHSDARWANGAYAGYWDLQSVAAHEFGHALGLGHVEPNATEATATAVMHAIVYRGTTQNRTLSRGDIEGASALYPRLYGFSFVSAKIENPAGSGQRMEPGRTYTAVVELENTGYRPWSVNDPNGISIATNPLGRCSSFAGADWPSCMLASRLDEATSEDPAGGPNVVAWGETGRFAFQIPARFSDEGRSSFEGFRVVGLPVSDPGVFSLLVEVGTYKMSVAGTSGPGLLLRDMLVRGIPGSVSVRIRNDGTAPWMIGDGRIRIVTDPIGRCSPHWTSDWADCRVPSWIDDQVNVVRPGEVATLGFGINSPFHTDTASRWYTERFDVEVAGRPQARMDARTVFRYQVM